MAGHDHPHHPTPLERVFSLLAPDRREVWIVLLFAVGVGVFTLATPLAAAAMLNNTALGTLAQQVFVLALGLLVALVLAALLQLLQTVTVEYIQRRLFARVVNDLAYRLPRVKAEAFDHDHGPEVVNRFFDVMTVQKSVATLMLDGITIVLQILIGLILLGVYDSALLGYDIVLIGGLLVMVFVLGRGAVGSAIRESISKYEVAGWMQEMARHRLAFKLAGGPRYARERADELTRDYLLKRQAHFRRVVRQFGFALFLQAFAIAGLLVVGGYLVSERRLTLGQLVAAEIVVTMVVGSFTKFGKQLESYYDLLAAADKLGHLMDLPLERAGGEAFPARAGGAKVAVLGVRFGYGGYGHTVLDRLDLTLAPGERVALTGPNGSGKTTLAELLFGLRLPDHGRIEIDDADLRDLSLESVRERIAIVSGVEVFDGTVLSNIGMGREEVTAADVRAALRSVGLLETILAYPDGLNSALGTGGTQLSLGQVNRLMLARALVGKPRLLVLDETLDHMDADIRENVLPAILGRDAPWTLLVITHSDEVSALCDRVIHLGKRLPDHAVPPVAAPTRPASHS